MTAGLVRALGTRRAMAIAVVLAMAVAATSIAIGFLTDDHGFRAALHSTNEHAPAAYDLFRFVPGDPADNQLRIRYGVLPWWAAPALRIHFLRPLTSLVFAATDRGFGDSPLAGHLVSLACYLAMLLAAAVMFRRWIPPAAATLAVAVFGLSAAHLEGYAWISARHVVIAGALAAAALAARGARQRWLAGRRQEVHAGPPELPGLQSQGRAEHSLPTAPSPTLEVTPSEVSAPRSRGRTEHGVLADAPELPRKPRAEPGLLSGLIYRLAAPLLFVAALTGSEAALAAAPPWIALELSATARPWRARWRACLPVIGISLGYLAVYAALGGGTRASGGYHDPMTDPLGFALLAAVRVPVLLGDAALGIPAELAHAVAEWRLALAGLAAVGIVALAWRWTVRTMASAATPTPRRHHASRAPRAVRAPDRDASVTAHRGASVTAPHDAAEAVDRDASAPARRGASSSTVHGGASATTQRDASVTALHGAAGALDRDASATAHRDGSSTPLDRADPALHDDSAVSPDAAAPISAAHRSTIAWLALGGIGATVLGATGFPSGRVLLIPDLAFAPLLGLVLYGGLTARWPGRTIAIVLAVIHLVIAPVAVLRGVAKLAHRARVTEAIATHIAELAPASGRVIIVAASDPMVYVYPRSILADVAPGAVRCWSVWSAAHAGHRVTRTGTHTLVVEPVERTMLDGSFDELYRAPGLPFAVGDTVQQCGATIRVAAVRDGRPARLEIELRRSLDDPEILLLAWRAHRLVRFTPPRIGETVELPWSAGPTGVL